METEQTIQRQRQRQREGDSDEVGSGHTPLDVLDGQVTWLVKHKTTRVPADLSNILFLNKIVAEVFQSRGQRQTRRNRDVGGEKSVDLTRHV